MRFGVMAVISSDGPDHGVGTTVVVRVSHRYDAVRIGRIHACHAFAGHGLTRRNTLPVTLPIRAGQGD